MLRWWQPCNSGRVSLYLFWTEGPVSPMQPPGQKVGVLAADVLYLASQAYPELPPASVQSLALDAFLKLGLLWQ